MGSTPSHSTQLVLELRGEDTAWWEQIVQQTQEDCYLLKLGDMAADCPGVLC